MYVCMYVCMYERVSGLVCVCVGGGGVRGGVSCCPP